MTCILSSAGQLLQKGDTTVRRGAPSVAAAPVQADPLSAVGCNEKGLNRSDPRPTGSFCVAAGWAAHTVDPYARFASSRTCGGACGKPPGTCRVGYRVVEHHHVPCTPPARMTESTCTFLSVVPPTVGDKSLNHPLRHEHFHVHAFVRGDGCKYSG